MKINRKELLTLYDFIDTIEEVQDEDIKLEINTDWEVDTTDNIIYIGDKQKTQLDDYFIEYLKTDKYNYFIISLLHEVGHVVTLTEELEEDQERMHSIYRYLYKSNIIDERQLCLAYFNIKAERLATEWARQYYDNHLNIIDDLIKKIGGIKKWTHKKDTRRELNTKKCKQTRRLKDWD